MEVIHGDNQPEEGASYPSIITSTRCQRDRHRELFQAGVAIGDISFWRGWAEEEGMDPDLLLGVLLVEEEIEPGSTSLSRNPELLEELRDSLGF